MLSVDFSARKGAFLLQPRFEARDELAVIIGASGSGKSLTLKAIAGLLTPDSGEIILPDGAVAFRSSGKIDMEPQRRSVGYVVQDLALFPHLTVRQNIAFALDGRPRAETQRRTDELIAVLGLEGTADRRPGAISGGQQQRVALARALAAEPRLLLLDEPFSALDTTLRTSLRRELLALRQRLGLTALFVTHDIDEAYTLADRIIAYDNGSVVQSGPRDDVFYHPATLEVAKLVGVRNYIPGDVIDATESEATVRTPWFTATARASDVAAGDAVRVCIRPEHILVLREAGAARDPRDIMLRARVVEDTAHPLQHSVVMRVEATSDTAAPLDLEIDIPAHPYALLHLSASEAREIVLPHEDVFVLPA